jgi:HEAT repeat protein
MAEIMRIMSGDRPPLRVFLSHSSELRRLPEVRSFAAGAESAISRAGHVIVDMAYFPAADNTPAELCRERVHSADVYVVIAGFHYGSLVCDRPDRSYTELEFETAVDVGLPKLVFLVDQEAEGPGSLFIDREHGDRQEAFRRRLTESGLTAAFIKSPDSLETALLDALHRVSGPAAAASTGVLGGELRAGYLAALTMRYRLLELSTLVPDGAEEQSFAVTEVFVPQLVRADPPPVELPKDVRRRLLETGDLDPDELPEELDRELLAAARAAHAATVPRPVLDLVTGSARRLLVLLGDPGAGKSTVLRFLALAMTTPASGADDTDAAEALTGLAGWLPLLVELRGYTDQQWRHGRWADATILDYLDYLYTQQRLGLPHQVLDRHLRDDGRVVVMFDGLDEVFDPSERADTARRITAFAATYPRAKVIVTSRITGYQRAVWDGTGFTVHTLQDLDRDQVARFVDRWYQQANVTDPEEARQRSHRLLAAIDRSAATRDLAGNPMLLTILAVIGRRRELPKERHRVYQHAVEVLTQFWDLNRAVRDSRVPMESIDEEDKRELLRRVARRMQEGLDGIAGNRLTRSELLVEFDGYLRERYQRPPDQARTIAKSMLEQFRDRNFILSKFGPGLFGFVHRALLEYCCADEIVYRLNVSQELPADELATDVFGIHADDPVWREVLLLTAGMIHERFLARVVDHLLALTRTPAARLNPDRGARLLILAMRCVNEARRISQLGSQCNALIENLVAQLTSAGLNVEHDPYLASAAVSELSGAAAVVRESGSAFTGRESYLAWYRDAHLPDAQYVGDAADDLVRAVTDLAIAFAPGDQDLRRHLQMQAKADPRSGVRRVALQALAQGWPDETTRTLITDCATTDKNPGVQRVAVQVLAQGWPDETTRTLITDRATTDENPILRGVAVQALARGWPDETTRTLITDCATADKEPGVRRAAVQALAQGWPEETSHTLITVRATTDTDPSVRRVAVQALVRGWPDETTRTLITNRATTDRDPGVRRPAVQALAQAWPDETTRTLITDRATTDTDPGVRRPAVHALAQIWPDETTRTLITDRATTDTDPSVRRVALHVLGHGWLDEATRTLIAHCATTDKASSVRRVAVQTLAQGWLDEATRTLITDRATTDNAPSVRRVALQALAQAWPDETTCTLITSRASTDEDSGIRAVAVQALAQGWPEQATRTVITHRATIDNDPSVRRVAVHVLRQGWPGEPIPVDDLYPLGVSQRGLGPAPGARQSRGE